jgi:chemotaxis protein histidine kinase CheA
MIGVTIARKWSCAPGSLPVSELASSRIHFRRCEPHRSRRGAAGKYHAHSLKGAAATIAAPTLQRTAHVLEVCCRNGRVCEAMEAYATLCSEMERLVTQLNGEKAHCSEGSC